MAEKQGTKSGHNAHQPRVKRRMVIIEANGYAVRAGIAHQRDGLVELECVTQSTLADPHAAACEAVDQLKSQAPRIPRDGIVMTAQAVAGIVELPISPHQPRPATQMRELVRWELEPVLAQALAGRPLGAIMVGRGHLTHRQATEIARYMGQPRHATNASKTKAGMRFGDTAIELGYLTRAQVDEALHIQQWFQLGDESYACGWSPVQTDNANHNVWPWYASAVSDEARDRWSQTLDTLGMRLKAMYPVVGCATASALTQSTTTDAVDQDPIAVVEIDPDQINCSHVSKGVLRHVAHHPTAEHGVDATHIAELCGAQTCGRVMLCGDHEQLQPIGEQLAEILSLPVNLIKLQATGSQDVSVLPAASARIHGVMAHLVQSPQRQSILPAIAPCDPAPALIRRPATWWTAAACLLIAVLAGVETKLRVDLSDAQSDLQTRQTMLDDLQKGIRRIEIDNARMAELEQTLKQFQAADQRVTRHERMFTEQLAHRNGWLDALLQTLGEVTPQGIAVNRIAQDDKQRLMLSGWAMSQNVPDAFAQRLNERLAGWGLEVQSNAIERSPGRLKLNGYGFLMKFGTNLAAKNADNAMDLAEGQQ